MGYLTFFSLNFIGIAIGLKVLESFNQLNAISSICAFICMWGIPALYWHNCLWRRPVKTMKISLLREVHDCWTSTIGFKGGRHLSGVIRSGNVSEIKEAKKRVVEVKKELLLRYEVMNFSNNDELKRSIEALEKN